MMRKTLSVCSVILVIVMLAALFAACGSKDTEEKPNIPAGSYKLVKIDLGGAALAPSKATILTIKDDGTGTADNEGTVLDLKVKSSDEITVGEDTYTYKLEDSKLIIMDYKSGTLAGGSGSEWIFEKM